MKTATLGLSVVLTGIGMWISQNLGYLFYVLLVVTVLDLITGWILMWRHQKEDVFSLKTVKSFGVLGIPVLVANFSKGLSPDTIFYALQVIFAILILAQLTVLVPNIFTLIRYATAHLFGKNSPITKDLDHYTQAELAKLIKDAEAAIEKAGMPATAIDQANTAMNSSDKGGTAKNG